MKISVVNFVWMFVGLVSLPLWILIVSLIGVLCSVGKLADKVDSALFPIPRWDPEP